ncbi:hypothetical protein B566_EDAN007537 [Ephemera danica]|nr:hypothetical protein B566_EDAN007537 [Ephemera danica]
MVSTSTFFVVLVALVTIAHAQRGFYQSGPWDQMYNGMQSVNGGTQSSSSASSSSSSSTGGLENRFGGSVDNDITFRVYNNIPIQGPEQPCVGCNYRLTNRGFIRLGY